MMRSAVLILFSVFILQFAILAIDASAACELDDVIYMIGKNYDRDKIRDQCRNKVNGLENCTLYKIIRLIKDKKSENYIRKQCGD